VTRRDVDDVRSERDEWRRRAHMALAATVTAPQPAVVPRRRLRMSRLLAGVSAVVLGLGLAAAPIAREGEQLRPDYPRCIGQARYEHPIDGNQYQELVNALYVGNVYVVPTAG